LILIADSSALIALAHCDCLEILEKLFGEIKVPEAVYKEVIYESKPESEKLKKFLFQKVEKINIQDYLILEGLLGSGEMEAMALYKKLNADWLLIDDEKARKAARFNKIKVIGSLGVLLLAKEKNLIQKIRPYVDQIQDSNIYYSEKILQEVFILANEV
jgi:predicted nucleic acid-binding protein